jgi:hypothetical protein
MIDTHCHLLPALDDGPTTRIQSLALATALIQAGVEFVLCTPHYSHRYPTIHALAADRLAALRQDIEAAGFPLQLGLASEVSPGLLISRAQEEIAARAIGDRVIVELEPKTPIGFLTEAVERLRALGLRPIFAHPERCQAVRKHWTTYARKERSPRSWPRASPDAGVRRSSGQPGSCFLPLESTSSQAIRIASRIVASISAVRSGLSLAVWAKRRSSISQ